MAGGLFMRRVCCSHGRTPRISGWGRAASSACLPTVKRDGQWSVAAKNWSKAEDGALVQGPKSRGAMSVRGLIPIS